MSRAAKGVPLIAGEGLVRRYQGRAGLAVTALAGVALQVMPGESVAVVGESGSGKSTLVRCLAALERPDQGHVHWDGTPVASLTPRSLRERRRHLQVIFQDSLASFNPRFTVAQILFEPLCNFPEALEGRSPAERARRLLERVGLDPGLSGRRARDLSGGQARRVAVARALASGPRLLLCDEPVSGLDVSVAAQVIGLLRELRHRDGLSLLFITHNLALVPSVSDRVAVMHAGRIVEELASRQLGQANHPYTRALLSAVPTLNSRADSGLSHPTCNTLPYA